MPRLRAEVLRSAFGLPVTAAALSTKSRRLLPSSAFGLPETRQYPIDTIDRARNALARVAANGTPDEQKRVRAAVKRHWPQIHVTIMKP